LAENELLQAFCARPAGMAMALARGKQLFFGGMAKLVHSLGHASENAIFFESTNQSMPAPSVRTSLSLAALTQDGSIDPLWTAKQTPAIA
jgi:hypothetical protein